MEAIQEPLQTVTPPVRHLEPLVRVPVAQQSLASLILIYTYNKNLENNFSISLVNRMQSYHYPPPKYRLPAPRYLPPPPNIPLSEDEITADAMYIPSRLIGPLLDFEDVDFSTIYQKAGDCIANLLTSSLRPARPFVFIKGGDYMAFTTEVENNNTDDDMSITIVNSEYSVEDIPPELGIDSLQRIDYREPDVTSLNRINILDLTDMATVDIPQRWRDRGIGVDRANAHFMDKPSYWRKMVEFLDQRTPAFIQKVRDEISRRYIVMTDPHSPEVQRQLFQALEQCRMSGVLPNLQKGVNARQRRVELHGLTEISRNKNTPWNVTRSIAKFVGKPNKTRRGRKSRKVRRTRKRR